MHPAGIGAWRDDYGVVRPHQPCDVDGLSHFRQWRLSFIECQPSAGDAIDCPDGENQKTDDPCGEADEYDHQNERHHADEAGPREGIPKSLNLPLKVWLEPSAECFGAFHIIDDDRNDRRPTEEKTADH